MSGNTTLIDYGIRTEESDMRAHVCVAARRVYIFSTDEARKAIDRGTYRLVPAYTGNIKTAEGYLVPPTDIFGCKSVEIPQTWFDTLSFTSEHDSAKGDKAVQIVARLAECFGLPVPSKLQIVNDHRSQVAGVDAICEPPRTRLQVKCDFKGGNREHGGTGNLFIQITECNPFGRK